MGFWGHPSTGDPDPLGAEELRLAIAMACFQISAGANHPPPGETVRFAQDIAYRSSRTREPRLFGDFAIGDHLSRLQGLEYAEDFVLESGHRVPKSRSPISPRPGRM